MQAVFIHHILRAGRRAYAVRQNTAKGSSLCFYVTSRFNIGDICPDWKTRSRKYGQLEKLESTGWI